MTRVHDMGGRFGDGPVVPEPQGVVPFAADWHKGALALTVAAGALGKWNIDTSRHVRESLAPKDYARFSYYEKWIAALADLLVDLLADLLVDLLLAVLVDLLDVLLDFLLDVLVDLLDVLLDLLLDLFVDLLVDLLADL